ncbi:hypothetical protein HaLaN_27595 [Haematococcus lacustris]|uniref:Uncharacterized protein n=1 Tax=Haematococcus lacustris TaxID=44745 RepID=A0A6A0A989_HAELA|nr:hypothetical protein HaLaN_27595 [Haematococcus lacustris]
MVSKGHTGTGNVTPANQTTKARNTMLTRARTILLNSSMTCFPRLRDGGPGGPEGDEGGGDGARARRSKVFKLDANLQQPVFRNCPLTGKDMLDKLSQLLDMRLSKEQMKGVLKLLRALLANQPDLNLITSFYQLMSLQGVQCANEYEVHVCNAGKDNKGNNKYCPGFTYPKIPRSEWLAHKDHSGKTRTGRDWTDHSLIKTRVEARSNGTSLT